MRKFFTESFVEMVSFPLEKIIGKIFLEIHWKTCLMVLFLVSKFTDGNGNFSFSLNSKNMCLLNLLLASFTEFEENRSIRFYARIFKMFDVRSFNII